MFFITLNQFLSFASFITFLLTKSQFRNRNYLIALKFKNKKTHSMPELPQVETVRRFLAMCLLTPSKKKIKSIKLYYPGIVRELEPKIFCNKLIGQTFQQIDRYGKYLILKLNKSSIISHLRMEGKYSYYKQKPQIGKHDHVQFLLDDGSYLLYSDVRKFGTMVLVQKGKQLEHKSIQKLGPQINNASQFNVEYLTNIVNTKKGMTKVILLDQEIICGAGNIYADEILFKAGVHPQKDISKLTKQQIAAIVYHGKVIIDNAIQNRGTTVRTFNANHELGTGQNYLNAYKRQGQLCNNCNYSKIKKIKVGGRGTHFCPSCQKL